MQTHLKLRHLSEVEALEPYHKRAKAAKVGIQTERVKPTIETKDTKQPDAKRTRSDMLLTGGIKSEIRRFGTLTNLQNHSTEMKTQPNVSTRKYKERQISGPWMNNLNNKAPSQSEELTCSTCREKYTTDCIVSGHKTTKDEPFSCKTCNKSFAKERDLKSHETFDHKRYFDCRLCGQGFADLKEVKKHQEFVHPEAVKAVAKQTEEEVRPYEFESVEKESIQAVVRQTKEAGKLYELETIKKKSVATKPEEVTYLLPNTSYECKECGKKYNCKSGLKLLK